MKTQKPKEIKVRVKDTTQFYSNETSINFNPVEINLDFKCVNQVQDIGEHSAIIIKHNVVTMQPFNAKTLTETLIKAIKDYEKKFGKIEKPQQIKKAEKLLKKQRVKKQETKIVQETKSIGTKTSELFFG